MLSAHDLLQLLRPSQKWIWGGVGAGIGIVLFLQGITPLLWKSEGRFREMNPGTGISPASQSMTSSLLGLSSSQIPKAMTSRALLAPVIQELGLQMEWHPSLALRICETLYRKLWAEWYSLGSTSYADFPDQHPPFSASHVVYNGSHARVLRVETLSKARYALYEGDQLLAEGIWGTPLQSSVVQWTLYPQEDLPPQGSWRVRLLPMNVLYERLEKRLSLQVDPDDRQTLYTALQWPDRLLVAPALDRVMGGYRALLLHEQEELLQQQLHHLERRQTQLLQAREQSLLERAERDRRLCATQGVETVVPSALHDFRGYYELKLHQARLALQQQRLAQGDSPTRAAQRAAVQHELELANERLQDLQGEAAALPQTWAEQQLSTLELETLTSTLNALAEIKEQADFTLHLGAPRSYPLDAGSIPWRPNHPLLFISLIAGGLLGGSLPIMMLTLRILRRGTPPTPSQLEARQFLTLQKSLSSSWALFLQRAQARKVLITGLQDPEWMVQLAASMEQLGRTVCCVALDPQGQDPCHLQKRLHQYLQERPRFLQWTPCPQHHWEISWMRDWARLLEDHQMDLLLLWTTQSATTPLARLMREEVEAHVIFPSGETLEELELALNSPQLSPSSTTHVCSTAFCCP